MLTTRDKAIIKDLNKFRVMDRNSIAELHFSNLKNPILSTNNVLLRLLRDGQIQRSTEFTPYVYFGPNVQIKKNSQKISHFLAILNTYKEIRKHGHIQTFLVEPKYSKKGCAEPDVFLKFRNTGFFIEVQKTLYSDKLMQGKMDRYLEFYQLNIMDPFPHVLILSDQRYAIDDEYPFKVFQSESFTDFINTLKGNNKVVPQIKQPSIKRVVNS
ncbi:hypothetical protein [Heyndrickxia oleronia]|uniref:hypothetical protein n=1 Tax=Heyndrickxia oleronia TaxID=38875 RepID=UPI00203C5660|nr:hypothetical protein [Heyndrickxia oleronia]